MKAAPKPRRRLADRPPVEPSRVDDCGMPATGSVGQQQGRRICVGQIAGARGLKGEFFVRPSPPIHEDSPNTGRFRTRRATAFQ